MTLRMRLGAKSQGLVPGEQRGWDTSQQSQGWQSPQRGLASQGKARSGALGSGQLDPSQTFSQCFPLPLRSEEGSGGCLGGRATWGRGAPFTESPGSKRSWAGGCFLESWKEQRNTESWGRCQTQSSLPRRMSQEGRRARHMENPASSTLPGEAAAPPQPAFPISFLFPPVPSRDSDWGPYHLALCGLQ